MRLSLRIGINTGEVIAGLLAGDVQGAYTVVGDTVNTAQRILQPAAVCGRTFWQRVIEPGDARRHRRSDRNDLRRPHRRVRQRARFSLPAQLLLELAGTPGDAALPAPGTIIPERMKQAELAALVGATRESINKWLGAFERQGLISYAKGQITLVRPGALKQRVY